MYLNTLPCPSCSCCPCRSGNQVYLYLTVAFIQMLKAFTPVITMFALFLARLEEPTAKMIAAVCSVAAGTALAAYGEVGPLGAGQRRS